MSFQVEELQELTEDLNKATEIINSVEDFSEIPVVERRNTLAGLLRIVSNFFEIENTLNTFKNKEDYVQSLLPNEPVKPVQDWKGDGEESKRNSNVLLTCGLVFTGTFLFFLIFSFIEDDWSGSFYEIIFLVIGIVSLIASFRSKQDYNKKIAEFPQKEQEYLRQCEEYEKEKAEIIEKAEKHYDAMSSLYRFINPFFQTIQNKGILSQRYFPYAFALSEYFTDGKADTMKEAIRLYEEDEHQKKLDRIQEEHYRAMEREAQRQTQVAQQQAVQRQMAGHNQCLFCKNHLQCSISVRHNNTGNCAAYRPN